MPDKAKSMENNDYVKELTERLENGMKDLLSSDKYREYLRAMSHFHNYSARNIMLIKLQRPDATLIASYNMWKEKFNRQVKKGEHGLRIYAPVGAKEPEKKLMEKLDPETGAPLLDDKGNVIMEEMTALTSGPRFKLVPVFAYEQTYGDPLPQLAEDLYGKVEHYEAFMDALKAASPLPIVFEEMDDIQDGYCVFGEKIAIREGMSEKQTVSAILHEITHARIHGKDRAVGEKPKSKEIRETEAESCAFVTCAHFGVDTGDNSFGYLASWGSHDLKEFKASLDVIRKESSSLIVAIEGHYKAIFKERGIETAPKEQQKTVEPEKSPEPEYTTETRKETIAGVEFEFHDIIPGGREKDVAPSVIMPTEPALDTTVAPEKSEALRFAEDYVDFITDYHGKHNLYTQKELETYIAGHAKSIENGMIDSYREAIERATSYPKTPEITERAKALLERINAMEEAYQAKAIDKSEQADDMPALMPDTAISVSERDLFGYTDNAILPLTKDKAIELFNKDIAVYLLYTDNSEAAALDLSDIENHDGIFGIDREDWLDSKEYALLFTEKNEAVRESEFAKVTSNPQIEYKSTPPPPASEPAPTPVKPIDVEVYKHPLEIARAHDDLPLYRQSLKLNKECAAAIDRAINTEPDRENTKSAVNTVVAEYGKERVSWVLANTVQKLGYDGRISSGNKAWAKGFEIPKAASDFFCEIHPVLLNSFINQYRETGNRRPSLLASLDAAERKSKEMFGDKSAPPRKDTLKTDRTEVQ